MTLASFLPLLRERELRSITNSYSEKGCRVNVAMDGVLLATIGGSNYQRANPSYQGKLADRIIFGDLRGNGFVCAVELKSGNLGHISDLKGQLPGALDLAAKLLEGIPVWDWYPVVLHGRRISTTSLAAINKARVSFRGTQRRIITRRCGASLTEILEAT